MACKCISKLIYSGLEIIVRSNEKVYWGVNKVVIIIIIITSISITGNAIFAVLTCEARVVVVIIIKYSQSL